jgi:hypothetical protein
VTFGQLLKKIDLWLRPTHREGADDRVEEATTFEPHGHGTAPTNWVPTQQDERPHH